MKWSPSKDKENRWKLKKNDSPAPGTYKELDNAYKTTKVRSPSFSLGKVCALV